MNDNGGPAFPTPRYERGDMYSLGMTLRDYFAAKALQGLLADSDLKATPKEFAQLAYAMANAMLESRK